MECVKEGTSIAEKFALDGFVSFVVDYPIGPTAFASSRAKNVGPIIDSAAAVLAYVRSLTSAPGAAAVNTDYGRLDAASISVCGFSAGGHLSLCLLAADNGALAGLLSSPPAVPPSNQKYPRIQSAVLVYPTLRSPTCWCIAGGLWMVPEAFGKNFEPAGEHRACFSSNAAAMADLLPSLPSNVLCVTVPGDMLLPAHKHSGALAKAVGAAEQSFNFEHHKTGPFYLYHGCGWHECWGGRAREFLREVFGEKKYKAAEEEGGDDKTRR